MRLFRSLAAPLALASLVALGPVLVGPDAHAQTPKERLERAQNAALRGDYATAEKELLEIKGGPERAQALLEKAKLELLLGRYGDAAKTAKSAQSLGKEGKVRGAALQAEALAAQGKVQEAVDALKGVQGDDKAFHAKLLLGELLIRQGKRSDARTPLKSLIDDYNNDLILDSDAEGLTLIGRAAHLLRNAREANNAFNLAEKAGGNKRVDTLLARAELFLDKHDPGHAGSVVKDALKLAPRNPHVHAAMARVKLESSMDFAAAESEINQALEVNPNLTSAFLVRAGLSLRDMDIEQADKAADKGLGVDPTDLPLLSMKAAIRYLADDPKGFEAAKKKVLGQNPEYSTMFQIIGEYAEWEHRYEDIVKMMQEAVVIDKADARAWATLGLNHIRSGNEKDGLEALRKAWEKDRFNVRVYNTLNLYEKNIPTEYVSVEGTRFVIRYAKDEKAILERYVPKMLDEAYESMVKRYGFRPKEPVHIELYADSEHFSIRTSGLPNVGIQGVCFGQTLAALSPAAAPFNWGNVLWHELGHVFAIQQSKNHVPRWYTEGLSEYETIVRRPEWQREEDPSLYAALKAGRVPSVEGFNRAFTHVDSVDQVVVAYYAASQILVFMVKEFGFPKVVSMLPKWGEGKRTPQVVREALGITPDELDKRFRAWLEKSFERYKKQYVPDLHAPPLDDARKAAKADPKNAKKLVELALALYADGQAPEGDAVIQEALKVDPKEPNAHYVLVKKALSKKDLKEAQRVLEKMFKDGHDGYALRMKAADIAEAQKELPKMKQNLEEAAKLDPSQAEPFQALYDLAHKQKDEAGELAALRRLAMLDQHERRVWVRLLRLLVKQGLWEEARQVGEGAMFIDVSNPEVHRLYARALARTGRFISAVYELNSAILCKPQTKDLIEIYGELAKAYEKLSQPEMAKQAAEFKRQLESIPAPKGDDKKKPEPVDAEET